MPNQAGERVQPDRREALQLARLRRAGELTPVSLPTVADEARRELRRAREETRRDLKAAKPRRNAWLRCHALRDTGRATWGPALLHWLTEVGCPTPAQQIVFQAYVRAVNEHSEHLKRLEQEWQAQVRSGA